MRLLLAATMLVAVTGPAAAQSRPTRATAVELILADGSRVYGSIESESDVEVVLVTVSGVRIVAPVGQIVSRRTVAGRLVGAEFWPDDPNDTRLLFAPTGRALRRGEGYLGIYEFLLPFVQVGVTDRLSIGGGTPLVFGLGEGDRPFWLTPKLQVLSSASTHAAVGLFHGFSPGDGGAGVAYGVVTRDTVSGSVTAGAGMAYASGGHRGPVVMIGADAPVRRNMKIITENYGWRSRGVASLGVRFFGDNLSADLALGVTFGSGGVFAMPVVNFMRRF